jgi:Zn finger protein HypA/HybF involved in hydrogenase expression
MKDDPDYADQEVKEVVDGFEEIWPEMVEAASNATPAGSKQKKRFFTYSRETGVCTCQHCGKAWKVDTDLQSRLQEEGQVVTCLDCGQHAVVEEDDWEVFILEDIDVQIDQM